MRVLIITVYIMFLAGCSGSAKISPVETTAVQQAKIIQKSENWLPTHHVTSQDFVFKNGKICSVNSLGDAFCSSTKRNFSLSSNIEAGKYSNQDVESPLTLEKENLTNRLKYLVKLKNDTALEYDIGEHSLVVNAKHSF